MANLDNMMETILIQEITRLYNLSGKGIGLSKEDMEKFHILARIKDTLKMSDDDKKKINPMNKKLSELVRIAQSSGRDDEPGHDK